MPKSCYSYVYVDLDLYINSERGDREAGDGHAG